MDFCKICCVGRYPELDSVSSNLSKGSSTKKVFHGESHELGDSMKSMGFQDAFQQNQEPIEESSNSSSKWYKTVHEWLKRKVGRSSTSYAMSFSAGRGGSIPKCAGRKTRISNCTMVMSRAVLDDAIPEEESPVSSISSLSFENLNCILKLMELKERSLREKIQDLRQQAYLTFWKAETYSLISERNSETFKGGNKIQILHKAVVHPQPRYAIRAQKLKPEEEELRQKKNETMWEEFIEKKVFEVGFSKRTENDKENQIPVRKQNINGVKRNVLRERNMNNTSDENFTVILQKGAKKRLGLTVNGGSSCAIADLGIIVAKIIDDSQAADARTLQVGDEILAVNDKSLHGMTTTAASEVIRQLPSGPVVLKMRRSHAIQKKIINFAKSKGYN